MAGPGRQGRRVLVGVVIMLVLLVLALGIFFLDRVRAMLRPSYDIVAIFATAPGLREGDDVWVAGVPSGRISSIDLLPPRDTTARVAMVLHLDASVKPQVRRDSPVRLATARTVGVKVVEIQPGSAGSPILQPGDTVHVEQPPNQAEVAARAKVLLARLDSLTVTIQDLRGRTGATMARYARLGRQVATAQAELSALMEGWSGGSMAGLLGSTGEGGAFQRLGRATGTIVDQVGAASDRFGAFAREFGPARQRLARDVGDLQRQLQELQERIAQSGGGTLPRFRSDSALTRAIHGVQTQLDSLVAEAKKDPTRFVF